MRYILDELVVCTGLGAIQLSSETSLAIRSHQNQSIHGWFPSKYRSYLYGVTTK